MYEVHKRQKKGRNKWATGAIIIISLALLVGGGYIAYTRLFAAKTPVEAVKQYVLYDETLSPNEQKILQDAIESQQITLSSDVQASAQMVTSLQNNTGILATYLPVTNFNAARQRVTSSQLAKEKFYVPAGTEPKIISALAELFDADTENIILLENDAELPDESVTFIPADTLAPTQKLLALDGQYYLDTPTKGAVFRQAVFSGEGAISLGALQLAQPLDTAQVYKANITGVTALTRVMMRRLAVVKDPLYFSAKIGDFLADADLTHVSNEVSFKENCTYSNTLFCSPPEFIETLKDSGVDLVELTGNHNNDLGSRYNTETINLYKSLGWGTVGGGLNAEEAAKPFIDDQKGSTVAYLAYNYPDSPTGGVVAGSDRAGANSFDFARIEKDIQAAKATADFTVVNVQYWECYAYPNGYLEYPQCDKPIGKQEADFKKIIDLGADMVIGSSAHQPQTYELYKGKPIYYGLGNLYFDQTSWPGTERGIVLTNYFFDGKLLQTKLTPTVYGKELQTRIMTDKEADFLLRRLKAAR